MVTDDNLLKGDETRKMLESSWLGVRGEAHGGRGPVPSMLAGEGLPEQFQKSLVATPPPCLFFKQPRETLRKALVQIHFG